MEAGILLQPDPVKRRNIFGCVLLLVNLLFELNELPLYQNFAGPFYAPMLVGAILFAILTLYSLSKSASRTSNVSLGVLILLLRVRKLYPPKGRSVLPEIVLPNLLPLLISISLILPMESRWGKWLRPISICKPDLVVLQAPIYSFAQPMHPSMPNYSIPTAPPPSYPDLPPNNTSHNQIPIPLPSNPGKL